MDRNFRLVLVSAVTLAVFFGFMGAGGGPSQRASFASLHIFLFNLTCGGTLMLTVLSGKPRPGLPETAFFLGGLAFALFAFFKAPLPGILSALILSGIAEGVRWRKFSWFPADFFRDMAASRKFEQASLLCLSLGLIICAATLFNNEYLKWFCLKKLDLHVFFLGFSFPISLITFSLSICQ